MAIFVAASRTPDERRGDLDAQLGANRLGVDAAPSSSRDAPFDEVVDYGERRMRAALARAARRRVRFEDVLDSTGGPGDRSRRRIAVRVTVDGDEITFDFTGTDAQRPGNVNAVEAVTVSAVAFALRSRSIRPSPATAARCGRCT